MLEVKRIQNFSEVYDIAIKSLDDITLEAKKTFLSASFVIGVACFVIFFIIFGLAATILLPRVIILINTFLQMYLSQTYSVVGPSFSWIGATLFFVFYGFILSFPGLQLSRRLKRMSRLFFVIQALIVAPFWAIFLQYLFDYAMGTPISLTQITSTAAISIAAITSLAVIISFTIYLILLLIPKSLFLVLTSAYKPRQDSILSRQRIRDAHNEVISSVMEKINFQIGVRSEEFFEDVIGVAKQRANALAVQSQTFALSIGLISLISIIVLFAPSQQIAIIFGSIDIFLAQLQVLSGSPIEQNFQSVYLASIVTILTLLVFLLIGWIYFSHTYKVLRALEVIDLFAEARLARIRSKKTRPLFL